MDVFPLVPPDLAAADPVSRGWARSLSRGPRTVAEVLRSASEAMDVEDARLELERDPITYLRIHRPRRLIDVLLRRY